MKTTQQNLDRPARNQKYVVYWRLTTGSVEQSAWGISLKAAKEVTKSLEKDSGIRDSWIVPV